MLTLTMRVSTLRYALYKACCLSTMYVAVKAKNSIIGLKLDFNTHGNDISLFIATHTEASLQVLSYGTLVAKCDRKLILQ